MSISLLNPVSLFYSLFNPTGNKPKPKETVKGNPTDENPKNVVNYNVKDNSKRNKFIYYAIGVAVFGFVAYKVIKKNK